MRTPRSGGSSASEFEPRRDCRPTKRLFSVRDDSVSQLLCRLNHLGVAVAEEDGRLRIEDPRNEVQGQLAEVVQRREPEILDHLRGSPGRDVLGYPDSFKIHPHAFQEMLINEPGGDVRVIEEFKGGRVVRRRWLNNGVSPQRMREIAAELGLE